MKSKITGRIESHQNSIEFLLIDTEDREPQCPRCGWIIHGPMSRFCPRCGYPVYMLKSAIKDFHGFAYIDHGTGFRIVVMKGKPEIRIFNKIMDVEELKQFVKEHGRDTP